MYFSFYALLIRCRIKVFLYKNGFKISICKDKNGFKIINLMNGSDYILNEKRYNCTKCIKKSIKQFQFCKIIAKNIFIKYPKNMFFMLGQNFDWQRTEIALSRNSENVRRSPEPKHTLWRILR